MNCLLFKNVVFMSHHYIRCEEVHYTYANGYEALRGASFLITHGEKVALVGANGAGKSTLSLLVSGLLLPTRGSVTIGDMPVSARTLSYIRQTVGLVFQNSDDQLFMPTVEEDVAFGPGNMGLSKQEIEHRVVQSLEAVGALSLRHRACYQLSGGQKKSVAIATVLAMGPSILVMDEPTSNLDSFARRRIMNQIRSFAHTCLIVTHDLEMVWEMCDRTMVMKEGRIVADGNTRDVFQNKRLLEKCGLEQPYRAYSD